MNHRELPCGVCQAPLLVRSVGPDSPESPELLSGDGLWFGILVRGASGKVETIEPGQALTMQVGMIVLCSETCAKQLARGVPVLVDAKNVGQA